MDWGEIYNKRHAVTGNNTKDNNILSQPVVERLIAAGLSTQSLRDIQPWKCVILSERNELFWEGFSLSLADLFGTNPEYFYYTKFYGPQFDHSRFASQSLATIVLCADWNSLNQEFEAVACFPPDTAHLFLMMEIGQVIQNLVLAIRNEGLAEFCFHIDGHIPHIQQYVSSFLQLPSHYRALGVIAVGLPSERIAVSSRPLDTFFYMEHWRNEDSAMQECPRASECKRFRFVFPQHCSTCSVLIKSHHYHDVPNAKIYCERCARFLLSASDDQETGPSKHTVPPKICEFWADCEGQRMFVPKVCSSCGGTMGAHWHDTDVERKYCVECTKRLLLTNAL